jgi:hypothetical protein
VDRLLPPFGETRAERLRSWFIFLLVTGIAWVPGGVTLAMLLSGNA